MRVENVPESELLVRYPIYFTSEIETEEVKEVEETNNESV